MFRFFFGGGGIICEEQPELGHWLCVAGQTPPHLIWARLMFWHVKKKIKRRESSWPTHHLTPSLRHSRLLSSRHCACRRRLQRQQDASLLSLGHAAFNVFYFYSIFVSFFLLWLFFFIFFYKTTKFGFMVSDQKDFASARTTDLTLLQWAN